MAEVINRIAWLEKQISTVETFVNKHAARIESGEAKFSDKISYNTNKSLLSKYRQELRQERELLNREVLNFRLIGDSVNQGTLPLGMLAKLSDKLNKVIHHAAFFVRNGSTPAKGVNAETVNNIDLRLSGLTLGSCNLQITGNINEDLAGDSLLGDAYKSIFKVLSDDQVLSFSSIAPTIGNAAVHNLDAMLEDIQKYNVALELKWSAPNGKKFRWGGNKEDVIKAREKLARVKTIDPVDLEMIGKITDLSVNGYFKLLEADQEKAVKVKYAQELIPAIDTLTLNDIVIASVIKYSELEEITGEEKHSYKLLSIRKYEDEK